SAGDLAASFGCNHPLVTRDSAVAAAVVEVLAGRTPAYAASCAGGRGGCLELPPRPATMIGSRVAAGIVRDGGTFGTAAVTVPRGSRATVLFTASAGIGGRRLEIWSRGKTGAYHLLTSRVAESGRIHRYF